MHRRTRPLGPDVTWFFHLDENHVNGTKERDVRLWSHRNTDSNVDTKYMGYMGKVGVGYQ
jgi:hypothetical protein